MFRLSIVIKILKNMIRLNIFSKLIKIIYIFFYLTSSNFAIFEDIYKKKFLNLEYELNQRNFNAIEKYFDDNEKKSFINKYKRLIDDFPNARWRILKSKPLDSNKHLLGISLNGTKTINGKEFKLESKFDYLLSLENGIIKKSNIRNNLTTIRNDNNQIAIDISIPNKVLTGSNYSIDIILNDPLGESIIAGAIKEHQSDKLFDEPVLLEPLATGGIFKITRAPLKPGIQIWTGMIAHPKGLISFTKSVNIIEKLEN